MAGERTAAIWLNQSPGDPSKHRGNALDSPSGWGERSTLMRGLEPGIGRVIGFLSKGDKD